MDVTVKLTLEVIKPPSAPDCIITLHQVQPQIARTLNSKLSTITNNIIHPPRTKRVKRLETVTVWKCYLLLLTQKKPWAARWPWRGWRCSAPIVYFCPRCILISCVPEPFPGTELHLLVFSASDALLRAFRGERISVEEIKTLNCPEPIRLHNNTELLGSRNSRGSALINDEQFYVWTKNQRQKRQNLFHTSSFIRFMKTKLLKVFYIHRHRVRQHSQTLKKKLI